MQGKYALSLVMVCLAPMACAAGEDPSAGEVRSTAAAVADARPVVLFVGTSLTAGYGLDPATAYPALIQRRIDSVGLRFRVVNAGVSGETSAGALRRLDWLLDQERPAVLVIETGANDGLRGQDPDSLAANVERMIEKARAVQPPPRIVLLAMEALPNLGRDYGDRFRAVFPRVARAAAVTLIPFFLSAVAGVDSLNQADGIHPTARGQEIAAQRVWAGMEGVLRAAEPGG